MTSAAPEYDLIVVGGGPGGSTLAALVAMQGHRVLLLEREKFPRHQIGESLLPATVHGICPLLGVAEEIKAANFMRKLGGTFRWGKNTKPWSFNFSSSASMAGPTGFAYQVERAKFDHILLNNARRKGVDVREEQFVTELLEDDGRVCGVRYLDAAGNAVTAKAKFVADASGHASRIYQRVAERVYSKFFENVALYGYYLDGFRLPPPNTGNVLCAAFDGGWFWYIPLSQELTSVGAVIARDKADILREGHATAMTKLIDSCPIIKQYLQTARPVTEGPYGKLRVRKDYSYCCTRFWAPGMVLIGDSACFVDPVFSSGVHLATYAGLLAARSINSCLRGELGEQRAFAEFEMRYRREYGNFYRFLVAFYDVNQDEESYFWSARKVLNSEDKSNDSFVRLVAGVATSGEPLFGSSEEFFEAMHSIGNSFQQATSVPGDFDQSKLDREFMTSFTREINQLQAQALLKGKQREAPLWAHGLVPTPDGLRWREISA